MANDHICIHTGCYTKTALDTLKVATFKNRQLCSGRFVRDDNGEVVFMDAHPFISAGAEAIAVFKEVIENACMHNAAAYRRAAKQNRKFLKNANRALFIASLLHGADSSTLMKSFGSDFFKEIVGTPWDPIRAETAKVLRNELKRIVGSCFSEARKSIDMNKQRAKFEEVAQKLCTLREDPASEALRFDVALGFGADDYEYAIDL